MDTDMYDEIYNSIEYWFDEKNNRYSFHYEADYFERGYLKITRSGRMFDVFIVNGHFVAIDHANTPLFVSDTFEELIEFVKSKTKCTPKDKTNFM